MPLRDPFHPPLDTLASWEEIRGAWPTTIAYRLNAILPPQYRSGVKVHLGSLMEVDVATFEHENGIHPQVEDSPGSVSAWKEVAPTILLETDGLAPAEYEVRVYDLRRANRLVAAVELVSPGNKDRPQSRKAFVDKCHALLQQDVCIAIVDTVTSLSANLYAELADRLGANPPRIADCPIYAVSCRTRSGSRRVRVETWEHELSVILLCPHSPAGEGEDLLPLSRGERGDGNPLLDGQFDAAFDRDEPGVARFQVVAEHPAKRVAFRLNFGIRVGLIQQAEQQRP
jgi:hypothetical protein